jgi:uncharacterized protein YdeI (BOF family)
MAAGLSILPAQASSLEDDGWVNVAGTVVKVGDDRFVIDTGERRIRVDVGEWPNPPAYRLVRTGEFVTVSGTLERNLLWSPVIGADTITRLDRPRSNADPYRQEMRRYLLGLVEPSYDGLRSAVRNSRQAPRVDGVAVSGVITDMGPRHLELSSDTGQVRVDFGTLIYESQGIAWLANLAEGDEISVQGRLDPDYVSNRTILAEDIMVRN